MLIISLNTKPLGFKYSLSETQETDVRQYNTREEPNLILFRCADGNSGVSVVRNRAFWHICGLGSDPCSASHVSVCLLLVSSTGKATSELKGKGISFKNELLFQRGINFNNLPDWQKRGVGIYREKIEKEGYNPITNEKVMTTRKQLFVDGHLFYSQFLAITNKLL